MAIGKPSAVITSDMSSSVDDYSNTPEDTSINEFIPRWSTWYGYYKTTNPVSSFINKKAIWTVGKGYKADPSTTKILDSITGFGKDTFNTIMENAVRVYSIGGDFLAEIIRNKRGKIVNLKPLNPGQFKIIANDRGIITRYEQISKETPGYSANQGSIALHKFKPEQIFHLAWNRTADDIHGVGAIERCEDVILKYKEITTDLKTVFHRYVKPIRFFEVDTDDDVEIANFKNKIDTAINKTENIVVPKGVLDNLTNFSVPQNATLNPMPWIRHLETEFFKTEGVPAVIQALGEGSSEAETKILYLAWQQTIEWNQLFLEQQIKAQLGLSVEFEFPASIEPSLLEDNSKAGNKKVNMNEAGKDE